MLLLFLLEYFEVFCIYYLYCSCKINPLTHFIFLIFHFLFLSETEGHHNRLRKADCARTNKNVPWHILAPSAVACDMFLLRASAHPRGAFFVSQDVISYETKNLQSIRMRITFLIQTNWRFSISPGLPLGFIYHLFLAL